MMPADLPLLSASPAIPPNFDFVGKQNFMAPDCSSSSLLLLLTFFLEFLFLPALRLDFLLRLFVLRTAKFLNRGRGSEAVLRGGRVHGGRASSSLASASGANRGDSLSAEIIMPYRTMQTPRYTLRSWSSGIQHSPNTACSPMPASEPCPCRLSPGSFLIPLPTNALTQPAHITYTYLIFVVMLPPLPGPIDVRVPPDAIFVFVEPLRRRFAKCVRIAPGQATCGLLPL